LPCFSKEGTIKKEILPVEKGFFVGCINFYTMSLSAYLWGIRLFLLLSVCAWVSIVIAVDPSRAGKVGMGLFLLSLFGVILGIMVLSVTWVYRRALGVVGATHHLGGAFRQASFLSLFGIVMVFLHMEQLLTWWDSLLLLAVILLLEFTARRFGKNES
jgi:hypothetical protein